MTEASEWIGVARLVRPQGRRGEVLAEILTDFPERFAGMREVLLQRREQTAPTPIQMERAWLHKGRVVLKFAGIDSITLAEELRGALMVVRPDSRMQLAEDAAYIGDLIGCELVDVHSSRDVVVGKVRDVIQQQQTADLLVVVANDGEEHWIPFAQAYRVRLDLAAHRIEMDLPPGLLEVNAPLNEEERREQQSEPSSQPSDEADL